MPPKGTIELKVTMDAGQFNTSTQQFLAQFKNMENAGARVAHAHGMMATNLSKLWRSALYGVTSYFSVSAIGGTIRGVSQDLDDLLKKRAQFERDITPLLSVSGGERSIQSIKGEVKDLAVSMRRDFGEISRTLYDFESDAENLKKEIRDGLKKEFIEFSKATGADLGSSGQLFLKTYQNAKEEIKDVNQLQNKLMYTLNNASGITPNQFAERLPDLLSATKVAGWSLDETLAALIGGSKTAGNSEKLFTGMRTAALVMSDVDKQRKAGLKFTGDLAKDLTILKEAIETNPQKFRDMFDTEALTAAAQMADGVERMVDAFKDLVAFKPGDLKDLAAAVNQFRFATDPEYRQTIQAESRQQYIEAARLGGPISGVSFAEGRDYGRARFAGGVPGNESLGMVAGAVSQSFAMPEKMKHAIAIARSGTADEQAAFMAREIVGGVREQLIQSSQLSYSMSPTSYAAGSSAVEQLKRLRPEGFVPGDFSKESLNPENVAPAAKEFATQFAEAMGPDWQGASGEREGESDSITTGRPTANAGINALVQELRSQRVTWRDTMGMIPGGGAMLGAGGIGTAGRFAGMGGLGKLAAWMEKYTGTVMNKMTSVWTPAVVGAGTNIASSLGSMEFPEASDQSGPGFSTKRLMGRYKDPHHGAINRMLFGSESAAPFRYMGGYSHLLPPEQKTGSFPELLRRPPEEGSFPEMLRRPYEAPIQYGRPIAGMPAKMLSRYRRSPEWDNSYFKRNKNIRRSPEWAALEAGGWSPDQAYVPTAHDSLVAARTSRKKGTGKSVAKQDDDSALKENTEAVKALTSAILKDTGGSKDVTRRSMGVPQSKGANFGEP